MTSTLLSAAVLAVAVTMPPSPLPAVEEADAGEHYFGYNGELRAEEIAAVREELRSAEGKCTRIEEPCEPGTRVLATLFGSTFRPVLPDVVIYVETRADGTLKVYRPLLLWKGKNTPYVYGARHLYVLLISDQRLPLDAKLTTIVDKSPNPLGGVLTLLKFPAAEAPGKEPESKTAAVSWAPLGTGPHGPYLGWARVDVALDSVNRLTITERTEEVKRTTTAAGSDDPTITVTRTVTGPEPLPGPETPVPFREITAHIGNSRSSRAGVGVALGATLNVADTALGEGSGEVHQNAYALAKVYALRPRLQVGPDKRTLFRPSVAVVFGTNIASDPFEELVAGVSVGHLIGKLGVTVGANLVKPPAEPEDAVDGGGEVGDRSRKYRVFVGLDYSF